MTSAELEQSWGVLIERVKALTPAPREALQPIYDAYTKWSIALSADKVGDIAPWNTEYAKALSAFANIESKQKKKLWLGWALALYGAGALAYWWNKRHRSY